MYFNIKEKKVETYRWKQIVFLGNIYEIQKYAIKKRKYKWKKNRWEQFQLPYIKKDDEQKKHAITTLQGQ